MSKDDRHPRLGAKVRALRRREGVSQAELARRMEISASYLNLIEHDRRPLTAALLIRLAQQFDLDLKAFAADDRSKLVAQLHEVFSDALFEGHELTNTDLKEFATASPTVARAVLALYQSYSAARESSDSLAERILAEGDDEGAGGGVHAVRQPTEEVNDLVQKHTNHFSDLEEAAVAARLQADFDLAGNHAALVHYLETEHGVRVTMVPVGAQGGVPLRRFDPARGTITLSEVLSARSRNFQLAHQIALLGQGELLDRLCADPILTSDESRALARVVLANYFAGAFMMPYDTYLAAARAERYDIERLCHRFRVSFEQACHRLTALGRPGDEGIPFHFVRVDVAGNISKRFSATGMHFARFSAACPLWNVHRAFFTPGTIRVQLSQMPEGPTFFGFARTVDRGAGGYHAAHTLHAIGMGCDVRHARELVYSDGVSLETKPAVVPIGIACRICDRPTCAQRAHPAMQHRLIIDPNVRGESLYAPA